MYTSSYGSFSVGGGAAVPVRVDLANFATSGVIGTSAATVDTATILNFSQTTAAVAVTLPSPTTATDHKTITLENNGTADLTVGGVAAGSDSVVIALGKVVEAAWNGTAWRLLSVQNLAAESGFANLANQALAAGSAAYVDVPGSTMVLTPGTWKIIYALANDHSTGATATVPHVVITDSANVVVEGSQNTRPGSVTTAQVLARVIDLAVAATATYKLRISNGSTTGFLTLLNSALHKSTLAWEKTSGLLPIAGTSISFVQASGAQGIGANIAAGDHAKFTTLSASSGVDITLDSATAYTSTAGVASLGRFTLKAGKTYLLRGNLGDIAYASASTSNYITYQWFNADTNTPLGARTTVNSDYGETYDGAGGTAEAITSPTVDTRVELRIAGVGNVASYGGNLASSLMHAQIIQLGSSALTSTQLARARFYLPANSATLVDGTTYTVSNTTAATWNVGGLTSSAGTITVPRTGLYRINGVLSGGFSTGATNIGFQVLIVANGVTRAITGSTYLAGIGAYTTLNCIVQLTAGQTVRIDATPRGMVGPYFISGEAQTFIEIEELPAAATA